MRHGGQRSIDALLAEQAAVFRLAQATPQVSRERVRHAVRSGRWQMPHRGIYVAHNGELTREQKLWVCYLAGPPGSALGGLTAAELDGLRQFEAPTIYLVIPPRARAPRRPDLIVKRSSQLTAADIHPLRRPTRTRMPRSLVDAASWQHHEVRVRSIILAGVQQRLTRPQDLRDALSRRPSCRHRRIIRQSIDDAEGGIASIPEHDFEQIRRTFNLPPPQRQVVVRGPDGRLYLDAAWLRYQVSVEIHGIQHMEILSWDADLDRQAFLAARGQRVLPFSSYAVRHRKAHVGTLITEALRNGGWRG